MFCSRCGAENADDAAFCSGCGNSLSAQAPPPTPEPTQVKMGKIRKCPACGTSVNAFDTACSACRHEFSDIEASRTIQSLYEKLQAVDYAADANDNDFVASRRAAIIRDYPIPNSRDELLELLYFIQPKLTDLSYDDPNYNDWSVKFSEVLMRAKSAYKNDSKKLVEIAEIEERGQLTKVGQSKKILKAAGGFAGGTGRVLATGMQFKNMLKIGIVAVALSFVALLVWAKRDADRRESVFCSTDKTYDGMMKDYALNMNNEMDRIDGIIENAKKMAADRKSADAIDSIESSEYKPCHVGWGEDYEKKAEEKFNKRKAVGLAKIKSMIR